MTRLAACLLLATGMALPGGHGAGAMPLAASRLGNPLAGGALAGQVMLRACLDPGLDWQRAGPAGTELFGPVLFDSASLDHRP